MSRSPYFFIEKFNENTGKYELQHPVIWNWNHTEQKFADLFPYNGCHDLFSIVENRAYNYPRMKGIHKGLPDNVCEEIQKQYDDCTWETEVYSFDDKDENKEPATKVITPDARWFTYADMYIYCLEHPTATDYEAMDEAYYNAKEGEEIETIITDTPMLVLKNRIDTFMEVVDDWGGWKDDYSQMRIVYWIL